MLSWRVLLQDTVTPPTTSRPIPKGGGRAHPPADPTPPTINATTPNFFPPKKPNSDVDVAFSEIYKGLFEKSLERNPSFALVPKFYFKKPTSKDKLLVDIRREARTRFLSRRSAELFDGATLDRMGSLLNSHGTLTKVGTGEENRINWDSFCAVAGELLQDGCDANVVRFFFNPASFLRFPPDARGAISSYDFHQFVARQVSLAQIRVGFSFYDSGGYGYLREEDLENYIFELIPTLPHLSSLGTEFYPFYVCTAVRKFFFFLDPSRKGKIQIKELLTSPMLAELFDLRAADLTEGDLQFNWFSATSAQRVYGQYLQLDVDRNGMLSRAEIAGIGDGTLTDIVLDRLFEETHTYAGEMDYKSFLDLALAMDNKKSIRGLEYFWRLLDVNHRGYITVQQISLFYRDVQKKMVAAFHEPANVADVIDEIFDMVKPLDPYKITFKDLIRCGCGDTIVSILTDVRGFYNYENRESFK